MLETNFESFKEKIIIADKGKSLVKAKFSEITDYDVKEKVLSLNGANFKLTSDAEKQFLSKIKIPFQYYDASSENLKQKEVEEGLSRFAPSMDHLFRVKENSIYGIVPKIHTSLYNGEIFEKLLHYLPEDVEFKSGSVNEALVNARFIIPSSIFGEDVLYPMLDISFSDGGASPFEIVSGIFRLVCTNGALTKDTDMKFSMPMTRFNDQVLDTGIKTTHYNVSKGMSKYMEVFNEMRTLTLSEDPIEEGEELKEDISVAICSILPSKVLRKNYGSAIVFDYIEEKNYTLNGMVNAVTSIAKKENAENRVALEMAAGTFISKMVKEKYKVNKGKDFSYSLDFLIDSFLKSKK